MEIKDFITIGISISGVIACWLTMAKNANKENGKQQAEAMKLEILVNRLIQDVSEIKDELRGFSLSATGDITAFRVTISRLETKVETLENTVNQINGRLSKLEGGT